MFERFFDEAGGMQLVIHAPFGSRINRAWGLALRKRFCRKFNFELQAAATEDNIVLSLTTAHSFELGDVARYLHSNSARAVLIQAMLDAPMFTTRWRWVAGVSLALPRFRSGKKVPPQLLRMRAEDLVAAVFPDQIACAENLVGEREVPDHPLTNQAIADCLHEAMDIEGLERLLRGLEAGEIRVVPCDLTEPSPLALEALSARPYAFLDDAPLEERRTQAVMTRRWRDPQSASDLGRLDPEAIAKVQAEAWPDPVNAEELHDALLWLGSLTEAEARANPGWSEWLAALARDRRVALMKAPEANLWISAERLAQFRAVWPEARLEPEIAPPADQAALTWLRDDALVEILRGRLEGLGPVTPTALAAPLGLEPAAAAAALVALERDGAILKGRFLAGVNDEQWCDRRLLARIHHYTVRRLRSEIEPVAARDFLRFLFAWQHVSEETRLEGPDALPAVLSALEGFEAPAKAWETEILPARLKGYQASWLDAQCLAGRTSWARLTPPIAANGRARHAAPVGATPIALIERRRAPLWTALAPLSGDAPMSGRARAVLETLSARGAMFFDELADAARLLRHELEQALGELVALGLAASDSFGGLRALLVPSGQRKPLPGAKRRGRVLSFDIESGGRWSLDRPRPAKRRRGVARRRGRIRGLGAAQALWNRVLAPARARAGMVAAVAGFAARLPPARGARRNPRRPLRRRILRRAIRAARRDRLIARDAPPPRIGPMGFAVGRRSAQSHRHPDAWPAALGADRQSRGLPGRPACRGADRGQGAVPDRTRGRRALGGGEAPRAIGRARQARRPRLTAGHGSAL